MRKCDLSKYAVISAGFCLAVSVFSGCAAGRKVKTEQVMSATETEKVESKYTGPKRRIGVVEFENKTVYGQGRLGTAASDILITELVKSGKFIVVDREKLNKVMEEQKFQMSGVVDPATASQIGKVLGLEAIVVGAVSQFGVRTEGSDYLIKQNKQQIAEVTVDIRIIDTETGQVTLADSGKGVTKKKWGSFLGMGTKGGYDESMEGDALRAAIVQFTDNIISQLNKKPWSCMIADAADSELYLNAGQPSGVEFGLKLDCYHQGAEIRDPMSNLVIGHKEAYIGKAQVERYCGDTGDCSVAKLISKGQSQAASGDICRLSQ